MNMYKKTLFSKKAQFAVEYTLVIAALFILLIPGIYLYYNYSQSALAEISGAKIADIGNALVNNAENAYYLGRGSRVSIDVSMPEGVSYNTDPVTNPGMGSRIECSSVVSATGMDHCEIIFDVDGNDIVFSTDIKLGRWKEDPNNLGAAIEPNGVGWLDEYSYFTEFQVTPGRKQIIIQTHDNFVTIDIK